MHISELDTPAVVIGFFFEVTEEHGHLDVPKELATIQDYKLGERLRVLPNRVCTTINMHNTLYKRAQRSSETGVHGRGARLRSIMQMSSEHVHKCSEGMA